MSVKNVKQLCDLGARLMSIADQVRDSVALYDVGTDHGYLPVALVLSGKTNSAVASDIAPAPLEKAKSTIALAGLNDKISAVLTSGLDGIALRDPCDIVIAGMGGEMIASIIDTKPELKSGDKRLILQPMTKAPFLREFLAENGFEIELEFITEEVKLYPIIVCRHGTEYSLSDEEKNVGKRGVRREDELFFRYVGQKINSLCSAYSGRKLAGIADENELELIKSLQELERNKI